MQIESFKQAEAFISSRVIYGIKPGLNRMKNMLLAINYKNKCKIIHVTGTNGKGSTTAYIEAGLLTSEKSIGTFTSPSLIDLTGHYTLNNKGMSETEFIYYLNQLMPIIKTLDENEDHPSEFEILTMIAVLYFEDKAHIAVIETGMGGLLDTTNVLHSSVSVITSIAIDHQAFLGSTLAEITKHKAGIIKKEIPIVLGNVEIKSLQIIKQTAKKNHAPLFKLGDEFTIQKGKNEFIYYEKETKTTQKFTLKNKGIYQSENASLALQVLLILHQQSVELNLTQCKKAIEQLNISNRFEIIQTNPQIIIDGAHNVASMQAFLKTVEETDKQEKHLIMSAFKDKPLEKMLKLAKDTFNTITITTFEHERAYTKEELNKLDLAVEVETEWTKIISNIEREKHSQVHYYFVGSVHFTNIIKKAINK